MQFRILGALEVLDSEGRSVDLGGAQARAVLVILLTAGDRVVPVDTIIDRLWPDEPPASASGTLQSYISRLRRVIDHKPAVEDGDRERRTLAWEARGYRLHPAGADTVDFVDFERLADRGRDLLAADEPRQARQVLAEALELWRGDALAEFTEQAWARGFANRLDERRMAALEDRIRADLVLGRHELVIGELGDLTAEFPLREGFRELHALALYRSGRQADALRAIDDLRRRLLDDLGVDPGHRIRQLETQILDHDPGLAAPIPVPVADAASTPDATDSNPTSSSTGIGAQATDPLQVDRVPRHLEGTTATELVGREAEQRVLAGALDDALASRTQWVVLEGEPGIGKTRLLEHLAQSAVERGFQVLWGHGYESGAPPAFWMWLGPLRGLVAMAGPLPDDVREPIDRLLSPTDEVAGTAPVDASRFRLFEAISHVVMQASRRQPVMLALDDLQWSDPASLELVEFLTGNLVGARVITACTVRQLELARNDAVVHALASISRRPLAHRMQLHGLTADESAELAALTVENHLANDVVDAIHHRSEGNPFFVGELARLLVADEGLTPAEQVRRAAVPAGVRDVVHRRLVRLPPATIELVQVAATIGRETSLNLLARAAGTPLDKCLDDLEPAFVDRLIVEAGGPGTVRFAHALVREVVLDDMSMLRLARLHLRVADSIEASPRRDDDAEIVAEHLWQAAALGVEERAAVALERAAEIALQRFAYESADTLLDRAIQLRGQFPSDRADPVAELDALNRLIQVRRVLQGFEGARVTTPIPRAKQLARATNREGVLMSVLWTEWAGACTSCDFDLAHDLSLELRALGAESDDPIISASGEGCWGIYCWHLGRIDEAVASLDESNAGYRRAADRISAGAVRGITVEYQLLTNCFHVFVHALAGAPLDGPSPLPAIVADLDDPYEQLVVWVFESLRALIAGDLDCARHANARARGIDVGDSFALFGSGARAVEGSLACLAGDASGVALIEQAAGQYAVNGVRTFAAFYFAIGSTGMAAAGEVDVARRLLERATRHLEHTGELWQEPYVLCAKACVAMVSGDRDAAVEAIQSARTVAIAQGAHGSEAFVRHQAERLDLVP